MTCKDCIHNDVCRGVYLAIQDNTKLTLKEFQILCEKEDFDNQDIALYDCLFFQDRSQFVELPYSLSEGDKLKYIFTDENNEIRIGDDWEVVTKICKDGFFVTGRINSDGTYQAGDCFYPWGAIGTEYFLTKEEAEQALKGRGNDEK